MLRKAQEQGFAVGAFNVENMEMAQAIISAAEELRAPVILQTTPSTVRYAGTGMYAAMVAALAQEAGEPVEYILCSGDPDSLDAILLPGKKAALVDGTAPHDTAPLGHPAKKVRICKGLRDQLLDGTSTGHGYLGHFCRTSYLIRGVTAQK